LFSNRRVHCGKLSEYAPEFFGLVSVAAGGYEVDREEAVPFLNSRRPVGKTIISRADRAQSPASTLISLRSFDRTESRASAKEAPSRALRLRLSCDLNQIKDLRRCLIGDRTSVLP